MAKYNYRQIMNEPIVIQQLTDRLSLPKPIAISTIIVFGLTAAVLYFVFNDVIWLINGVIPGTFILVYLGIPYGANKILGMLKFDGLKMSQYLSSRFNYWWQVKRKHKQVYQGVLVDSIDEEVVFTSAKKAQIQQRK